MEKEYKIIDPTTLDGEPLEEAISHDEDEAFFAELTVDEDGLFDSDIEEKGAVKESKEVDEAYDNSRYEEEGYKNRKEYLKGLADEFGVPVDKVFALASVLGPDEDFDALISELDDLAYFDDEDNFEPDDEEPLRIATPNDKLEGSDGTYVCVSYYDVYKTERTLKKFYSVDEVVEFILDNVSNGFYVTVENYADDNIIFYYTPEKYYDGVIRTSELIDEHPFD